MTINGQPDQEFELCGCGRREGIVVSSCVRRPGEPWRCAWCNAEMIPKGATFDVLAAASEVVAGRWEGAP